MNSSPMFQRAPHPNSQCLPNGSDVDSGLHYHRPVEFGFVRPIFAPPPIYASPIPFDAMNSYGVMARPLPPMASILKQIDYYFSDANLIKDLFLRSKMDDYGFVPITLVANFPRVKNLTEDTPYILNSLRFSRIVEVQGEKIRRRNGWKRWILSSEYMNE